jgi:competence ComEA-like helix-hairpin-helix protein
MQAVEIPLQVRLFILSLALVAIASCKSTDRAANTNPNSVALSANRADETPGAQTRPNEPCLNLNVATPRELIKLPGIGEVMAKRIIDYRERHGRFRRPEEIIIIEGFSERKYRAIARMVCIE